MRIAIEGPQLNLMKFWISVKNQTAYLINIVAKILGGGETGLWGGISQVSPPYETLCSDVY